MINSNINKLLEDAENEISELRMRIESLNNQLNEAIEKKKELKDLAIKEKSNNTKVVKDENSNKVPPV